MTKPKTPKIRTHPFTPISIEQEDAIRKGEGQKVLKEIEDKYKNKIDGKIYYVICEVDFQKLKNDHQNP